jgi:hypothetical protein
MRLPVFASLGLRASVVKILAVFQPVEQGHFTPMRITQRCNPQPIVHPIALSTGYANPK